MTSKWLIPLFKRLDVVGLDKKQPVARNAARYPRKGAQLGLLFVKGG